MSPGPVRPIEERPAQSADLARRTLLMTGLIAGFSLAAGRGEADPIHTDAAGLTAGEIRLPVADTALPTYFAKPSGHGPFPTILIIEEIFGVHEYIMDVCRRLAKRGYLAVAPELYARLADLSTMSDPKQIFSQVILKAPDATMIDDLDHAAAWAVTQGGDPARLGVMGFCRGGRDTWLYAEHNPRLRAAVAWYGPVVGPTSPIQPKNPVDGATALKCPLLGLYGGQDQSISQPDVQRAAALARQSGHPVKIEIFPPAGHGFHADYRPSYDAQAAKVGWDHALGWFARYGVA